MFANRNYEADASYWLTFDPQWEYQLKAFNAGDEITIKGIIQDVSMVQSIQLEHGERYSGIIHLSNCELLQERSDD